MIFLASRALQRGSVESFWLISSAKGGFGVDFGLPGCRSGFYRNIMFKCLNAHRTGNNSCLLSSWVVQLWSEILICVVFPRSSVNGSSKSSGNDWSKFAEAVWKLAAESKYCLGFPSLTRTRVVALKRSDVSGGWRGGLAARGASFIPQCESALAGGHAGWPSSWWPSRLGWGLRWSRLGCLFKALSPTVIFKNLDSSDFVILRCSEGFRSELTASSVVKMCLASAGSELCPRSAGFVLWSKGMLCSW